MRKKAIILLFVLVISGTGCRNRGSEVTAKVTNKVTAKLNSGKAVIEEVNMLKSTDELILIAEEAITKTKAEEVTTEESLSETKNQEETVSSKKGNNSTSSQANGGNSPDGTQTVYNQTTNQEQESYELNLSVRQSERIEYDPQNVVALATAKVQAGGKITLTDDLDNLLASGAITQEEYNEYYPYDGAGYFSIFVDSNLAEARDISGTDHFQSEDDIASYIADMLLLERGDLFLIVYQGTYDYYGKILYEFRCYRA